MVKSCGGKESSIFITGMRNKVEEVANLAKLLAKLLATTLMGLYGKPSPEEITAKLLLPRIAEKAFPVSHTDCCWSLLCFSTWMPSWEYLFYNTHLLRYACLQLHTYSLVTSFACFGDASTWTWHSTGKNITKSRSHFLCLARRAMLSKTQLNCSWGFFPAPVCPPSSGRAVVSAARRPRVALTSLLTSDRLTRVQDNVTFEKTTCIRWNITLWGLEWRSISRQWEPLAWT